MALGPRTTYGRGGQRRVVSLCHNDARNEWRVCVAFQDEMQRQGGGEVMLLGRGCARRKKGRGDPHSRAQTTAAMPGSAPDSFRTLRRSGSGNAENTNIKKGEKGGDERLATRQQECPNEKGRKWGPNKLGMLTALKGKETGERISARRWLRNY